MTEEAEQTSDGAGPSEPHRPPMVVPKAGQRGDVPVKTGTKRVLGMKVPARGEPFYFLGTGGVLPRRYQTRFPVTEQGWADAWSRFAAEDPQAAAAYVATIEDQARRAALSAQRPRHAETAAGRLDDAVVAKQTIQSLVVLGVVICVVGGLIAGFGYPRINVDAFGKITASGSLGAFIAGLVILWIGSWAMLVGLVGKGVELAVRAARVTRSQPSAPPASTSPASTSDREPEDDG